MKILDTLKNLVKRPPKKKVWYSAGGVLVVLFGLILWINAAAPQVVGGEEITFRKKVAFNAPLRFEFSEHMATGSVEKYFSIVPPMNGQFLWEDGRTLFFKPDISPEIGTEIEVTIGADARSFWGKRMGFVYSQTFLMVGSPQVTFLSPIAPHEWEEWKHIQQGEPSDAMTGGEAANPLSLPPSSPSAISSESDGSISSEQNTQPENQFPFLKPGEPIVIMFDRPIRPLQSTEIKLQETLTRFEEFVNFTPEIPGTFRWLGTSAIEFLPDPDNFPMGNSFTAEIRKGAPTADGGTLTHDLTWHFETEEPQVVAITPVDHSAFVSPRTKVKIIWNQPVDEQSFFTHLSITPDLPEGQPRKIRTSWDRDKEPNSMFVSFDPYFAKDEVITITLTPGVKSLRGAKVSTKEFVSTFHTMGDPKILANTPRNDTTIAPRATLSLDFSTPMDAEKIRQHLEFTPAIPLEKISVWQDYDIPENTNRYRISVPLEAQTDYTWKLTEGLEDQRMDLFQEGVRAGMLEKISEAEQTLLEEESVLPGGFSVRFHTGDFDPFLTQLSRGGGRGVYDSDETTSLFVQHRNVEHLNITVCEVPEENFLNKELSWEDWGEKPCTKIGKNPTSWQEKLSNTTNVMSVTEVPLSERVKMENGIYAYEFSSPQYLNRQGNPAQFSGTLVRVNATLTAKWMNDKVLFWATDFTKGEPLEGMEITVFQNRPETGSREKIGTLVTDIYGLATASFPLKNDGYRQYFAVGRKGEKFLSFVGQYWNEGIGNWDFGIDSDYQEHPFFRGYMYTDRPIYRPNQTVYFKEILRANHDAMLSLPDISVPLRVVIESPTGDEVYRSPANLTTAGTFFGKFQLAPEVELGTYFLRTEIGPEEQPQTLYQTFSVEEYRKPDFAIQLIPVKRPGASESDFDVFRGEDLSLEISGKYYFGGSISGGKVDSTVVREPYFFHEWTGPGWYSFAVDESFCYWECFPEETVVLNSSEELDANGKVRLTVPTDFEEEGSELLTVYTTMSDAAERSVSKAETFVVYAADGFVGIRPEEYFVTAQDDTVRFPVLTIDTKGKRRGNELVRVELSQTKWNAIQKEGVDGVFYWENTKESVFLREGEVVTDGQGEGTVVFPLPADDLRYSGELEARAFWKDSHGRQAAASVTVYRGTDVSVPGRRDNNDRIKLTLDQNSYHSGDIARLLVASPFSEPVKALVTVERKNILDSKIVTMENGKFINIPVTDNMLPNSFVSVVLVKGKGILGDIKKLLAQKVHNIARQEELTATLPELKTKSEEAKAELEGLPETATQVEKRQAETRARVAEDRWTEAQNELEILKTATPILETDIRNLIQEIPAAERASINLEALTAEITKNKEQDTLHVRPEMKVGLIPLLVDTDEKKLTVTLTPDKEEYLPGEKVQLSVETTDVNGVGLPADVSLAVVDESVLALKSRSLQNILEFFWSVRPLGVSTTNTLVYFVERLNVKAERGEKGGGGGDLSAEKLAKRQRGEFRDTAFWLPSIQTDGSGLAKTEFVLPDNLTTWQIWAVAATKDTVVGTQTKSFVARKKLMVEPALPRFAVVGDEFTAAFLLHNQSGKPQNVNVTLDTKYFRTSEKERQLFLEKDESMLVEFPGTVDTEQKGILSEFEPMQFTFTAKSTVSGLRDEIAVTVSVHSPVVSENIATSGETEDLQTEYVRIPAGVLEDVGNLTVSLSASRIGPFLDGLESLQTYPYGCAEQIMSQDLPVIALRRLESEIGQTLVEPDPKFAENISTALQAVYQVQRADGGFGYWQNDAYSYPYLSAYILYGLLNFREAGIAVDNTVLEKVQAYLSAKLYERTRTGDPWEPLMDNDTRAFILFVLTEAKAREVMAMKNLLLERLDEMSLAGKIFLLMASQNIGDNVFERKELLATIERASRHTPRGVQFETGSSTPWAMDTDVKTTALALMAIAREDGNHPLLPKIVAYLTQTKDQGRYSGSWGSTQNTAWVILAYLEYLKNTSVLNPNFTATVELNGEAFDEKTFTENDIFVREISDAIPIAPLFKGNQLNELDFSKEGAGTLFYDIVANYYLPVHEVTEQNAGIGIFRSYYRLDDTKMKEPVTTARKGERLRGKVTVTVPDARHFVAVSEKLPAGLEAVNFNLETVDASLLLNDKQHSNPWLWWDNLWYFQHKEVRDDEVVLFANYLPAGMYEYDFYVTATTEGTFQHLPAIAEEMYRPEVFGRTNGEVFVVAGSRE